MIDLSLAFNVNARTRPIFDGRAVPEGIRLTISQVNGSELYWRQLKFGDFDASEMSTASLFIAASRGDSQWLALPVFSMRKFFHTWAIVRADAGIATPLDLHGKRVGVPEYQQTSAVWARGILQDEFGVDWRRIQWFMERPPERSHGGATGSETPAGVQLSYVAQDSSLAEMLLAGKLDASLSYLAVPNLVDRGTIDLASRSEIRTLFDPLVEQKRYYEKTRLFPFNHCMVVRRSLLEAHPWIALNLYNAFAQAKSIATRDRDDALEPYYDAGIAERATFDADPMRYGVKANRVALETLSRYLFEQGLTERVVGLDEVFVRSTLDL